MKIDNQVLIELLGVSTCVIGISINLISSEIEDKRILGNILLIIPAGINLFFALILFNNQLC